MNMGLSAVRISSNGSHWTAGIPQVALVCGLCQLCNWLHFNLFLIWQVCPLLYSPKDGGLPLILLSYTDCARRGLCINYFMSNTLSDLFFMAGIIPFRSFLLFCCWWYVQGCLCFTLVTSPADDTFFWFAS